MEYTALFFSGIAALTAILSVYYTWQSNRQTVQHRLIDHHRRLLDKGNEVFIQLRSLDLRFQELTYKCPNKVKDRISKLLDETNDMVYTIQKQNTLLKTLTTDNFTTKQITTKELNHVEFGLDDLIAQLPKVFESAELIQSEIAGEQKNNT